MHQFKKKQLNYSCRFSQLKPQKIINHHERKSFVIGKSANTGYLELSQKNINNQQYTNFDSSNMEIILSQMQREHSKLPENFTLLKAKSEKKKGFKSVKDLLDGSFQVLSHTINELIEYATLIIINTSYCSTIFTPRVARKMVTMIARNYNLVAYHNFSHAFYLTLLNYQCFKKEFSLRFICSDQEYFYIIVAGLCHDINHNGKNNAFQSKTNSELARLSNHQSVLQNMHIRHIWKMLQEHPEFDFIAPSKDKVKARNIITRLILNTDMAFHSKNLQKIKILKGQNLDIKKNENNKWTIIQLIFHACDIGNACANYDQYMNWCVLVAQQFNETTNLQKQLGLDTSKSLYQPNIQAIYKDQLFFVGNLVIPLWKQIDGIFPHLKQHSKKLEQNLNRVKKELSLLKN